MENTFLLSGFTALYSDSGITLPHAWIQISNIIYAPSQYCIVVYDIYADCNAYIAGFSPIFQNNRTDPARSGDPAWTLYYDPLAEKANAHIQAQALAHLQTFLTNGKMEKAS